MGDSFTQVWPHRRLCGSATPAMGVHGLWRVLAPVGRRVDVQTLQGKIVAVDASIWLTQFIKAMRSREDGRMIHNAHILGSLRRILKLLANKIKPLFVFDGGVPVLKRRIREARRAKADFNERMLKRAAQKLLLNQMLLREVTQAQQAHKKQVLPSDARKTPVSGADSDFVMPKAGPSSKQGQNSSTSSSSSSSSSTSAQNAEGKHDLNTAAINTSIKPRGAESDEDDEDDEDLPLGISWSETGSAQRGQATSSVSSKPTKFDFAGDIEAVSGQADTQADKKAKQNDGNDEDDIFADISDQVEDIIAQLPMGPDGTVDISSIGVLPKRLQFEVIALLKDKRRQRESKRNEFIPVAGDPRQYSAMQLTHFLKDVNLKKRLDHVESSLAKASGDGKRIASDARVQYVLKDSETNKTPTVTPTHQKSAKAGIFANLTVANESTLQKILAQKPGRNSEAFFEMQKNAAAAAKGFAEDDDEALSKAMNTASHLTSWAANAVRSAVRKRKAAAAALMVSNPTQNEETNDTSSSSSTSQNAPVVLRNGKAQRIDLDSDSDSDDSDFEIIAETKQSAKTRKVMMDDDDADGDEVRLGKMENGQFVQDASNLSTPVDLVQSDNEGKTSICQTSTSQQVNLASSDDSDIEHVSSPKYSAQTNHSSTHSTTNANMNQNTFPQQSKADLKESHTESIRTKDELGEDSRSDSSLQKIKTGNAVDLEDSSSDDDDDFLDSIQFEETPNAPPAPQASLKESPKIKPVMLRLPTEHFAYLKTSSVVASQPQLSRMASSTEYVKEVGSLRHAANAGYINTIATSAAPPGSLNTCDESISREVEMKEPIEVNDTPGQTIPSPQPASLEVDKPKRDSEEDVIIEEDEVERKEKDVNQDVVEHGAPKHSQDEIAVVINKQEEAETPEKDQSDMTSAQYGEELLDSLEDVELPDTQRAKDMDSLNIIENQDIEEIPDSPDADLNADPSAEFAEDIAAADAAARVSAEQTRVAALSESKEERDARLKAARKSLVQESESLAKVRYAAQRDSETVTPAMLEDVKELLKLFGLPYVESPMEAEAQCAELELAGIVDGVVTDDCDAFLFGARNVYKNIFDDRKYVEVYKVPDVEQELGLDRKKMIYMALLLGSDYTTGIKGIGVVNASEIVHAFNDLSKFRKWVNSPSELDINEEAHDDTPSQREFKRTHRKAKDKWVVPEQFPPQQVIEAYEKPVVASLPKDFRLEFQEIQEDNIRRYLFAKLGWSESDTNAQISRPLQAFRERNVQSTLDSFVVSYRDEARFAAVRSKRLQNVISDMSKQTKGKRKVRFVNSVGIEVDKTNKKKQKQ